MSRNEFAAIFLVSSIAFAGCAPMPRPNPRGVVDNRMPSSMARPESLNQRAFASRSGAESMSNPRGNASSIGSGQTPGQFTEPPALNKVSAQGHVCDENCSHNQHSVVGPDGVIGLPQFRLSSLAERETGDAIPIVPPGDAPVPSGDSWSVSLNEGSSPTIPGTVTPKARESRLTIPVAQPLAMKSGASSNPAYNSDATATDRPSVDRIPAEPSGTEGATASIPTVSDPDSQVRQIAMSDATTSRVKNPSIEKNVSEKVRTGSLPSLTGTLAERIRSAASSRMPEESLVQAARAEDDTRSTAEAIRSDQPGDNEQELTVQARAGSSTTDATGPVSSSAQSFGILVDPSLRNPASVMDSAMDRESPAGSASPPPGLRMQQAPAASDSRQLVSPLSATEPQAIPSSGQRADSSITQASFVESASSRTMSQSGNRARLITTPSSVSPPAIADETNKGNEAPVEKSFTVWINGLSTSLPWPDRGSKFESPQPVPEPGRPVPGPSRSRFAAAPLPKPESPAINKLTCPHAAMTTEIVSFGNYLPFDSTKLHPHQTVLIYCELQGYQSVEERNTAGRSTWNTILDSRVVVTNAKGETVQQEAYPTLRDIAPVPREQFYMYVPLKIGELPPGNYTAVVEISDMNQKSATRTRPLEFTLR